MGKALIVCTSVSHGNTRKVADAIGAVLEARVLAPEQVDVADFATYDVVGFGSGIYYNAFHPQLRRFVADLPMQPQRRRAFVFATSGFAESKFRGFTVPFVRALDEKGFDVIDTFSVRAHDTFGPFALVGGLHKGRPNDADLAAARAFASRLAI